MMLRPVSARTLYSLDVLARSFSSSAAAAPSFAQDSVPEELAAPIEYRHISEGRFATKHHDMLEPAWVGDFGIATEEFVIDGEGRAAANLDALGARGREAFEKHGVALFENTGLTDAADMAKLARQVLPSEMRYEGGSNPRNNVSGQSNVYEVGAPIRARIHYHTEMAYVGESTAALAFMALEVLPNGRGATYITNKVQATDALLATPFGQRLKREGVCYQRDLTDRRQFEGKVEEGVYNHWQQSFETEDPAEAEAIALSKGLQVQWEEGTNKMLTRYYADAYEYDPYTDRNILFSSIADSAAWFDEWPLVQHLPHEERPLRMTFGDDVPFSRADLLEYMRVHDEFGMQVPWKQQGDVAIICNRRIAHGRPGIDIHPGEKRQLGVMLASKFERRGQLEDKW